MSDVAAVAARLIRGREDLRRRRDYPPDLWRGLAEAGLLGLTVPEEYGGKGRDLERLADDCREMVRHGRSLGAMLAWKVHCTLCLFAIARLGDEVQKQAWLPRLATGETTLAAAISEPGAGAHPKYLKARAERLPDGGWQLDGEKAWITNGPSAGLFIVVAVKDESGGRKRFGAFLLPADTPGLARTEAGAVEFLRPTGHCGLSLRDVRLPASAELAPDTDIWSAFAKPLRNVEDLLKLGSQRGAMEALLDDAAEAGLADEALGGLAARLVSFEALAALPGRDEARLLAARQQQRDFLAAFEALELPEDPARAALIADMTASDSVAGRVHAIRLAALGREARGAAAADSPAGAKAIA
ncbi:MAG: acyl-CoA dehydrogenase family protein [Alphaproteobacteria bacterium]|nr:acyl-CoA dehydrogenase family protein [Alphaproteobacteria bacterium]